MMKTATVNLTLICLGYRRLWFSSGAEVTMSAPSFSDAVFSYDGGHFQISISLNY
jgi:uncharacterized protein (DUF2141 family)